MARTPEKEQTVTDTATQAPAPDDAQPDEAQPDTAERAPEHVDVEVVEHPDLDAEPMVPEPATPGTALERAAEMAMEQAHIPGRDEFLSLAMQARIFAYSNLVPRALQGKPNDVFLVLMTGRDLHLPVTTALRKVYVIDGTVSVAPLLRIGAVARLGLGSVKPHPENRKRRDWAGAIVRDQFGNVIGETEFTWQDAAEAGLVRADCAPGQHTSECIANRGKDGVKQQGNRGANFCKDNWRKNPGRMCWWRAAGFAVDDYFPEASMGLYSPDELGALTDDDGEPLDPANMELPEGFGPPNARRGANNGSVSRPAAPDAASDQDKAALKGRTARLDPRFFTGAEDGSTARGALLALWGDSDGKEPLPPVHSLLAKHLGRAKAMVTSIEKRAEKGEWGVWTPPDPDTGQPQAAVALTVGNLVFCTECGHSHLPGADHVTDCADCPHSGPQGGGAPTTAPDADKAPTGQPAAAAEQPDTSPLGKVEAEVLRMESGAVMAELIRRQLPIEGPHLKRVRVLAIARLADTNPGGGPDGLPDYPEFDIDPDDDSH